MDSEGDRRVALEPKASPDRPAVTYLQVPDGDSYFVYPSDVLPLVQAGRIDSTLFDVAYLAEHGFSDEVTDELPVIAQYDSTARAAGTLAARTDALPASSDVTPLPVVHGAGFDVDKDHTSEFWAAITGSPGRSKAPTTAPRTLRAGLTKLWMDRLVVPTLDRSTAQVGAPAAWEQGLDGTGTTVAVLDTGLDLDHPDLAGRVLTAKNFTSDESVHDGYGHGTHVASIVAGTGAASGGKYRGVAPGASLMIGKVLNDFGTGSITAVIEGMQWAAESGADVVNMSLGSGATDGTDLQSQAVNDLTAQYGTLFVVAAGNSGPGPQTVGAPSVAEAALSVAAVDRADQMASFSSRGPRLGDFGLKPDIAAPGVSITAARSEPSILAGEPGEKYMTISGTSMASPHVAGAAAILKQKNPKWTAGELKPVLVSTAKDAGHRSYEQGAGRLDTTRALNQQVYATSNVDFGMIAHPQTGPAHRELNYVNRSDQDVTLDLTAALSSEDGPAPAGMVRLDRDSVTVPANGTAQVTVTVDPTKGEPTWYEGAVRATADGIEIGAAIGLYKEPESFEVTGKVILPENVQQSQIGAFIFTRDDGRLDRTSVVLGAPKLETTVRLHAGPHTATVTLLWRDENGFHTAIGMRPEFKVDGDTTVTIDLRDIQRINVRTPKASEDYSSVFGILRLGVGKVGGVQASATANPVRGQYGWLLPTDQVKIGSLEMISQHILGAPPIEMSVARGPRLHPRYQEADVLGVPMLDGRRTLPLVDGGTGTPADLARIDARGALVLLDLSDFCQLTLCTNDARTRVAEVANTGAAAVIAYGPRGHIVVGAGTAAPYAIPTMGIPTDEARMLLGRLARGPVRIDTNGTPLTPYRYHLFFSEEGKVPRDLDHTVRQRQLHRLDHRFHADAPSTVEQQYSARHTDRDLAGVMIPFKRRSQSTITDYVGPVSKDVVWQRSVTYEYDELVNGSPLGPVYNSNDVFDRPGRTTEVWNSRPLTTGPNSISPAAFANKWMADEGCYTCRTGDTMVVDAEMRDPFGHPMGRMIRPEKYRLTRDGVEYELNERHYLVPVWIFLLRIPVDTFDVPADRGTYRLEYETNNAIYPQMRYSTTERSTYTFQSERPVAQFENCIGHRLLGGAEPCGPDRILRLRYDIRLGLDNTAEAGGSQRITVSGFYGNGLDAPKLRSLDLSMSTDDGRTWKKIRVRKWRGTFSGVIHHPELNDAPGAVTLRAKAVDVNGNVVEQTIDRAYGLR